MLKCLQFFQMELVDWERTMEYVETDLAHWGQTDVADLAENVV